MSKEVVVQDEIVVSMSYELMVDKEVIDSTDKIEGESIEFIQGLGQIIPGLEAALYEMKVGDTKQVKVEPAQAYGDVDPEAFIWVPREDFPETIPLEIGTVFEMTEENGDTHLARIIDLQPEKAHVDLNHPLAGKELEFKVEIVGLRSATSEELEHGHVHDLEDHGH